MASKEKVKKKQKSLKTESGSVLSVREATNESKSDTVVEYVEPTNPESQSGMAAKPEQPLNKSSVSLQSREAWAEQAETPVSSRPPSVNLRTSRPPSALSNNSRPTSALSNNSRPPSALSKNSRPPSALSKNSVRPLTDLEVDAPNSVSDVVSNKAPSLTNLSESTRTSQFAEKAANAYVPYLYARDSVAKVVEDMKKMKNNHIRIVCEIENTYKSIEDETQAQFNAFVLNLRNQQNTKVTTFRQVIELHRLELSRKQQYWDEALASFSERNRTLLKEKKTLLIQNKLGFSKIEEEKEKEIKRLTALLEETQAALEAVTKDKARLQNEVAGSREQTLLKKEPVQKNEAVGVLKTNEKKLRKEAENLKRILELVLVEVEGLKAEIETAGPHLYDRLHKAQEENVLAEKTLSASDQEWLAFQQEQGQHITLDSAEMHPLLEKLKEAGSHHENCKLRLAALEMMSSGFKTDSDRSESDSNRLIADFSIGHPKEDPTAETTAALQSAEEEIKQLQEKIEELESQLEQADSQNYGSSSTSVVYEQELSAQVSELQKQLDEKEVELSVEKAAHALSRDEIASLKLQMITFTTELENSKDEHRTRLEANEERFKSELGSLQLKLDESEKSVNELEEARLANVPADTKKVIKELQDKNVEVAKARDVAFREKTALEADVKELKAKFNSQLKIVENQKTTSTDTEKKLKALREEKDKEVKDLQQTFDKKQKERVKQEERKVAALEKKLREVETKSAADKNRTNRPVTGGPSSDSKVRDLQEKLREATKENKDLTNRNKQLEKDLLIAEKTGGGGVNDEKEKKKLEKKFADAEKKLDASAKKIEKFEKEIKEKEQSLQWANKDIKDKAAEILRLTTELAALGSAAKEAAETATQLKALEKDLKNLTKENKQLAENFNTERVLRKKYYNMVEDMKGKIRVYCRARPMSQSEIDRGNYSCVKSPDEYTININAKHGAKEFQFDSIFMPDSTQEKVFEDTNNLIQSAVDGYNVCIFAYGQTGSGKTFTIIGDKEQKYPGIAPRAFEGIFQLIEENKSKFTFTVEVYMMELYNDRLIDLFGKARAGDEKLEIKKDEKKMVFVQGAQIRPARNAKELMTLFEDGSKNRHTASTKMNADSSRSHLVIGIIIESTNKATGQVLKGKLSLVDLAGSERASKTEARPEQVKEANSINKSLSALGDVISALSSEQSFIPYRNNKLTMLMQDSLGGNAKTLMFVNISPADYNADESTISLMYASRVKLITNDASKNADNKEISRLKGIIAQMKKGEAVDENELD